MKFINYLNEKRSKNIIVVDVQPMYKNYINFDIESFGQFLLEQRKILYFYNGPDTVGEDNKNDIINWLFEETYNDDLIDKLSSKETYGFDKGYAFFRSGMDQGADTGFIKQAIRYMINKKVYDSRDIDPEEGKEKFPDEGEDYMEDDMIYLPDIPLNILKKGSGGYITGGGKNECLKELQILLSVINVKVKEVKDFIY